MNTKILVVDDQKDLGELLSMSLSGEGYIVRTATTGAEAIASVQRDRPDLILLDILLPDMSGIKLTTQWKNDIRTSQVPIILLTAKDSETDIVVGLSVGADDYITKPFSTKVLLARMEAVLRRTYPDSDPVKQVFSVGPVRVFPSGRQVFVEGKPVELTGTEFTLLLAMVQANGGILSRADLGKLVADFAGGDRIIDVHIAAIRKKLGNARDCIKTVHGQGYRAAF